MKIHSYRLTVLALTLVFAAAPGARTNPPAGRQFYVAPNGRSSGDGSMLNPWDLQTALSQPTSVQAGDTINLRGGAYFGHYNSNLTGTSSAPITVQSYPGEWARIDGYATTTLAEPVGSSDTSVKLRLDRFFPLGTTARVEGEDLYLFDTNNPGYRVMRGWGGTPQASHNTTAPVAAVGVMLTVSGSDTIYRDFEVLDSNPARIYSTIGDASSRRGSSGVFVLGPRVKLINLFLHDNQDGVFMGVSAVAAEVYGCIVYNNGHCDPARGEGHGLYLQNRDATQPKKVTDCVMFNNFATGAKAFGETAPSVGVIFSGNMSFNNGSPASFPGNPTGFPTSFRQNNLFVGNGSVAPEYITVTNNYLYHGPGAFVGANLGLSYVVLGGAGLVVRDNYIAGGNQSIGVGGYTSAEITGNVFYASKLSTTGGANETLASATTTPTFNWKWDNNTYFDDTTARDNDARYSFNFNQATNIFGGGNLQYSETPSPLGKGWKEWTGFDANSTYTKSRPSGTKVFVRPNQYESGRAHIAIYNWDRQTSVSVDISGIGLNSGDRYTLYDVQNYPVPLLTGSYTGSPVSIPMTGGLIVKPIGFGEALSSTLPEFGVYLIRKSPPVVVSPPTTLRIQ